MIRLNEMRKMKLLALLGEYITPQKNSLGENKNISSRKMIFFEVDNNHKTGLTNFSFFPMSLKF